MAVEPRATGLCRDCVHARRVDTRKKEVYWRCASKRAEHGKYPRLPVTECRGYEREEE